MAQSEILKFLKYNKNEWFSSKKIAEKINASGIRICINLQRLRKSNFLFFKFDNKTKRYLYKYKK